MGMSDVLAFSPVRYESYDHAVPAVSCLLDLN